MCKAQHRCEGSSTSCQRQVGLVGVDAGPQCHPRSQAHTPVVEAGSEWLEVGPVKDFATGIPQKAEYTQLRRDGWIEETVKKAVWILTKDGQQFTAYDPRCTHLGCAYSWQADRNRFFCPCHDGIYDVDGRVIGGPPPRPLDRYETKVENGTLYIGMMYRLNANLERVS